MKKKSFLLVLLLHLTYPAIPTAFSLPLEPTMVGTIQEIKTSYQKHEYEQTLDLATRYLTTFNNDVDASLYKGLAYQQLQRCNEAIPVFSGILDSHPAYIDARLAMVNCLFTLKNEKEALVIIDKGLAETPEQIDLLFSKAKALSLQGQRSEAIVILKRIINIDKNYGPAQTLLNNLILEKKEQAVEPVTKNKVKAHRSHNASITRAKPTNNAKQLDNNAEYPPRYVVGIYSDTMLVNVPHQAWNLSSLYAYRKLSKGTFGGAVNYANRYNQQAAQLELNVVPEITKHLFLDLTYAYANKPELFANQLERAEFYAYLPQGFEASFGASHRQIAHSVLNAITGSLGKYIGGYYYVNFRPTHFVPGSGPKSTFYRLGMRRYTDNPNQFIGLVLGGGTSPDLTDLLTVNYIKVRNRLILLEGQQPINTTYAFQYGVGYETLRYPNDFLRKLVHLSVGIRAGFM